MNILLTGGRAPAALELARAFHRAGHSVFMAESLHGHLSQPSAAIQANFIVPAPRQHKEAFLSALNHIITANKIDVLIPTCEETFYVSMGSDQLPCAVFVESINQLNALHNKWDFVINTLEMGLLAPETMLIKNQDDILQAFDRWRSLILKPVYSRFAARILMRPSIKRALSMLNFESPWIAQEFIEGHPYCTYSVCHNGIVHAHTTYPSVFTAGEGATIVFGHVEHPAIFNWVKTFVKERNFTGQIAFDFIQTQQGELFALECNPRTTSGVHLLASNPQFIEAIIGQNPGCVRPMGTSPRMISAAMLAYALPASIRSGQFFEWMQTYLTSRDVIFDIHDPLPSLFQFRSIITYIALARKYGITPLEASTLDIEWNGSM